MKIKITLEQTPVECNDRNHALSVMAIRRAVILSAEYFQQVILLLCDYLIVGGWLGRKRKDHLRIYLSKTTESKVRLVQARVSQSWFCCHFGWNKLSLWASILCFEGCLSEYLTSIHCMQVPPMVLTTKHTFSQCSISLGIKIIPSWESFVSVDTGAGIEYINWYISKLKWNGFFIWVGPGLWEK